MPADEAAVLQEISALSNALAAKPTGMLRQRAILQLAYAAVHAMHKDVSCSWDAVHQQEQELAASAAQGTTHLLHKQLMEGMSLALIVQYLLSLNQQLEADEQQYVAPSCLLHRRQYLFVAPFVHLINGSFTKRSCPNLLTQMKLHMCLVGALMVCQFHIEAADRLQLHSLLTVFIPLTAVSCPYRILHLWQPVKHPGRLHNQLMLLLLKTSFASLCLLGVHSHIAAGLACRLRNPGQCSGRYVEDPAQQHGI